MPADPTPAPEAIGRLCDFCDPDRYPRDGDGRVLVAAAREEYRTLRAAAAESRALREERDAAQRERDEARARIDRALDKIRTVYAAIGASSPSWAALCSVAGILTAAYPAPAARETGLRCVYCKAPQPTGARWHFSPAGCRASYDCVVCPPCLASADAAPERAATEPAAACDHRWIEYRPGGGLPGPEDPGAWCSKCLATKTPAQVDAERAATEGEGHAE